MYSTVNKKSKIIAMVPARLGSKRIKSKNLRLIGGRPLISHILTTIKKTSVFDEIYLNSEGDVFREIAEAHGVQFYQRDLGLASDEATNDAFAYDFLRATDCEYLIQILPTSPFLGVGEIERFVSMIVSENLDGLISVEAKQIACVYRGVPINFRKEKVNPPSQEMTPILAYATALMGWRKQIFMKNYEDLGAAYHCPRGKVDYFPISGISAIDIDNEEDFLLAEAIMQTNGHISLADPQYYKGT